MSGCVTHHYSERGWIGAASAVVGADASTHTHTHTHKHKDTTVKHIVGALPKIFSHTLIRWQFFGCYVRRGRRRRQWLYRKIHTSEGVWVCSMYMDTGQNYRKILSRSPSLSLFPSLPLSHHRFGHIPRMNVRWYSSLLLYIGRSFGFPWTEHFSRYSTISTRYTNNCWRPHYFNFSRLFFCVEKLFAQCIRSGSLKKINDPDKLYEKRMNGRFAVGLKKYWFFFRRNRPKIHCKFITGKGSPKSIIEF